MNSRRKRHAIEVLPTALIIILVFLFVTMSAINSGTTEKELRVLSSGWSVSGHEVESLPGVEYCSPEQSTVLSIRLTDEFDSAQSLCFYTVYESAAVRVDGEEIYRYEKYPDERITVAPPSCWNIVPLMDGIGGKTLEIELNSPYARYSNVIPKVYFGKNAAVDRFVNQKTIPTFAVSIAVLIIGLLSAIVAVILRYYIIGSSGLYSLSLFVVMLAIFLSSQQTTLFLKLNQKMPYILIQNVAFMLCTVMYSRYLMRSSKGARHRIALGLHALSIFNLVVICILQLCRVKDMPEMMSSTRNLSIIMAIYAFLIEMRQHRKIIAGVFATVIGYEVYYYYLTGSVNWVLYVLMILYVFMMIYRLVGAVVRSQIKEIRLQSALEVSKSEIATIQITSHFFYHTLDSIRALIRIDSDKAYKMTGDFAKYIRYRVDGVERLQETVPFSRELRSIRAYTDIKQAQLGDRFKMIFDIETDDFEILPLTVQPLVENAVIHAVQKRRDGGEVALICRETPVSYHIEVRDNGTGGSSEPEVKNDQQASTAIRNVNTRLEFYGIAQIRFEDNELGGKTVSVEYPKSIIHKEENDERYSGR